MTGKTTELRGAGTYDDPVREVKQYWENGELVHEDDPLDGFMDGENVCECSI